MTPLLTKTFAPVLSSNPSTGSGCTSLFSGAQGVALNAALQQAVDDVETHNRALRAKADAIPAAERGGLAVDDFCALPTRADIDDVIQEAERNLAASREQQSIRTAGIFEPFLLPEISTDAISTVLAEELADLEATAAKKVQVHLVGIGEGGEAWVAAGMERVAEHALEYCPFCAQNLSGSTIINHYRAYFSEAYAGLKERVARKIEEFTFYGGGSPGDFDSPADFERAIRVAVERRQFWSRFTDIPEIALDTAAITQAWSAAKAVVLATLHAKQDRPLESLQLSRDATAAIQTYELRRREVELLSYSLQDANRAIAVVREQAAAGNIVALERDVALYRAAKARHSPALAPLCADYLAEKAAKASAEARRDAARTALNRYRETIFPAYQSAINEYLRRFNAGFRLTQITPQNMRGGSACTYNVLINNQEIPIGATTIPGNPSFRNSLSAGDRNTLALAFFFASLDQDQELADKIVVIDDPVSSLDEHRSLTTVREMRRLMQRTQQVVVLSHNKPFLCSIWDATEGTQRVALELVRDGDGSSIRAWEVNCEAKEGSKRVVVVVMGTEPHRTGVDGDGW